MSDPATSTPSRLERAVDWTLGVISPKRAALRQHLRRYERDLEYRDAFSALMRARGYRAARSSGTSTPWTGSSQLSSCACVGSSL